MIFTVAMVTVLASFEPNIVVSLNSMASSDDVIDILKTKCHLDPLLNSPTTSLFDENGESLKIQVNLWMDRLLHVSDVNESFEFTANIDFVWFMDCLIEIYQDEQWPKHIKRLSNLPPTVLWHPKMFHRNSLGPTLLENGDTSQLLEINLEMGLMMTTFISHFSCHCDMDFFKFPFDE